MMTLKSIEAKQHKKEYMKKYMLSYVNTSEGRQRLRAAYKRYISKPEAKVKKDKRMKLWRMTYRARPEIQQHEKEYNLKYKNRPEVKLRNSKYLKVHHMKYHYIYRYGITIQEVDKLIRKQHGLCKICNRKLLSKGLSARSQTIDHDHKTGKVRGILCRNCNNVLGNAFDKSAILKNAAKYLDSHSKS